MLWGPVPSYDAVSLTPYEIAYLCGELDLKPLLLISPIGMTRDFRTQFLKASEPAK